MAGWFKVKAKEPTWTSGGGDLRAGLQAHAQGAREAVAAIVEATVQEIMDQAVAKWPEGPDRGDPPRPHSKTLFRLVRGGGGWLVQYEIVNSADYSRYIYRPGSNRQRLVAEEEILVPLREALPALREAVARAVVKEYTGG